MCFLPTAMKSLEIVFNYFSYPGLKHQESNWALRTNQSTKRLQDTLMFKEPVKLSVKMTRW